jgi:hypothetical protein
VPYVAGLSAVRVKATVASVDPSRGMLTAGGLTVDYTAHLSLDPGVAPAVGDVVEISGIQPIAGGMLIVGSSGGGLRVAPTELTGRR